MRAAIIKSAGNVSVETVDDPTPGQAGFEGEFAPCCRRCLDTNTPVPRPVVSTCIKLALDPLKCRTDRPED